MIVRGGTNKWVNDVCGMISIIVGGLVCEIGFVICICGVVGFYNVFIRVYLDVGL